MEYDKKLKNRLRRIEGQVRGVLGMMESEKDCKELVGQLSAVRAAVDKTIALVIAENLVNCLREEVAEEPKVSQLLNEAVELLVKSR